MVAGTARKVIDALQAYDLKEEVSGKRYRSNSPLRPGSNSQAFTLTLDDDEHGAYYDHVSKDAGSLYDLAKHLAIALPDVQIPDSKRAYAGLEDYARSHGVAGEVLREWQWRETSYKGRPALEYPTRTGARWRFLDGNKPHYISPPGYQRCWYGLNKTLRAAIDRGLPLVVCNGEISTITGQHYGLPAVALTGGEKGEVPDNLMSELIAAIPTSTPVLIALDCDPAGRAAARGLETQFRERGYEARAVDLSLSLQGDLADFCTLYGEESLLRLIDLPDIPTYIEPQRWEFFTVDDILKLPPIEWLVPRQIPSRGLTMIYGASGSFKSFFILDLAIKLGLQGKRVVYVAAEGESGYRQRLEAWIQHHKTMPQNITFVLSSVDLYNGDELAAFSQLLSVTHKPDLIIFDTLAMCSGIADEKSGRDMLAVVQNCKNSSRNLSCAIVLIHHTNQEGRKERGSKVIRNSCDTIIRVSKEDDLLVVESQKTKDTARFQTYRLSPITVSLGYRNNIGEDVSSIVLLPAESVIHNENTLTPNQRAVLEALAAQPNATISELADITEIENSGSVSRAITSLAKKGLIRIVAGTREITPEGHAQLDSIDSIDSGDSVDSVIRPYTLPLANPAQPTESCESCESTESPNHDLFGRSPIASDYYRAGL